MSGSQDKTMVAEDRWSATVGNYKGLGREEKGMATTWLMGMAGSDVSDSRLAAVRWWWSQWRLGSSDGSWLKGLKGLCHFYFILLCGFRA